MSIVIESFRNPRLSGAFSSQLPCEIKLQISYQEAARLWKL